MKNLAWTLVGPLALLAACNDAEDRMERAAETSAEAAGPAEAALGLSEAQLLDAELVDPNGIELGDVESVSRDANGNVDRLLIEIEDSNPDRFVYIPIDGLSTIVRGDDVDLQTTMTRNDLLALPEVQLN